MDRKAPDRRFMCQASSIAFLANQDFDFNKLFKYGIPYLNSNEEEMLLKRFEEKQKLKEEKPDIISISDTDKPQIEEIWYIIYFLHFSPCLILLENFNRFKRNSFEKCLEVLR